MRAGRERHRADAIIRQDVTLATCMQYCRKLVMATFRILHRTRENLVIMSTRYRNMHTAFSRERDFGVCQASQSPISSAVA